MLALDASVTLAWCFEDENSAEVQALMLRVAQAGACVPSLWRYEVANTLHLAVRRKRINQAQRDAAIVELAALDIQTDAESDAHIWSATLQLAARYDLTVYDASYLELAARRRLPLATCDAALIAAAKKAGVAVA